MVAISVGKVKPMPIAMTRVGEHRGEVGAPGMGLGEPDETDHETSTSGQQHRPRPDARQQCRGHPGDDQEHDRRGGLPETGVKCVVAQYILQKQ